jgi:hypothetical protein
VRRHYIIVYVPETNSIVVYTACREKVVKQTGAGTDRSWKKHWGGKVE